VGTGLKQIAAEAAAPFGSNLPLLPRRQAGAGRRGDPQVREMYEDLVMGVLGRADNAVDAMRVVPAPPPSCWWKRVRGRLPDRHGRPRVASTNEALRAVTAEVFASWTDAGAGVFVGWGFPPDVARRLSVAFILALEGAFVLARTLRDTEPLESRQPR